MTEKQKEQLSRLDNALTEVLVAGSKETQYDQEGIEVPGTEEVYPDVTLEDACGDNLVDMILVQDVETGSFCLVPSIFFELSKFFHDLQDRDIDAKKNS